MPDGGSLRITAGTERVEGDSKPHTYARLTVADTGIGMDEATMARVYEPFFTTKPEGKGTGLGLSMVYGLVSGAGGSISVASTVGTGSTFSILLPLAEVEAPKRDDKLARSRVARQCQVLIVDAKPEIGSLIERILKREGFPAHWVNSAEAAVIALEESGGSYGLLIVQGVTPGMSTGAIIDRAREKNPDCRVIVLSAPSIEKEVMDAVNEGHYHMLPKPFESEGLRRVVGAALSSEPGPVQGVGHA